MSFLFGKTAQAKDYTPTNVPMEDTFHIVDEPSKPVTKPLEIVPIQRSLGQNEPPRMPTMEEQIYPNAIVSESDNEQAISEQDQESDSDYEPDSQSETDSETESEPEEELEPMLIYKPNRHTMKYLKDGYYHIVYKHNGGSYVGDIVNGERHGLGKFTFPPDENGFQNSLHGRFENGNLVEGTMFTDSFVMTGTFEVNEDGSECLDGPECDIEYCSGITYSGPVEMDEPYADGEYTIPEGMTVTFEGQTGLLKREDTFWVVEFETGPIKKVSSEDFDCIDECFEDDSEIRVEFRDGCVFEGVLWENNQGGKFTEEYNVKNALNGDNYQDWGHFQSMCWLMAEFHGFPIKFFDVVQERQLTLRQIESFRNPQWKMLHLDPIQRTQLKDRIYHG